MKPSSPRAGAAGGGGGSCGSRTAAILRSRCCRCCGGPSSSSSSPAVAGTTSPRTPSTTTTTNKTQLQCARYRRRSLLLHPARWFLPVATFLAGLWLGGLFFGGDTIVGRGGTTAGRNYYLSFSSLTLQQQRQRERRREDLLLPERNANAIVDHISCAPNSTTAATGSAADSNNNDGDGYGWSAVHVFYGDTAPFAGQPHLVNRTWFSQAGQDEVVWGLLREKRQGYFVDLAANDATLLSNTYALERDHGWTGLCVEPNPEYWYNLSTIRPTCSIVGAVVGSPESRMQPVKFRYEAGDHGGIADRGFDNGPRWQRTSLPAYTVPLVEIFRRFNVPRVIDYMSLDVEGAESFILMNFPFDEYTIRVLTAERLKGGIRGYLKANGFVFLKRLSTWGESLWAHNSTISQLDLRHLDKYEFPII